MGWVEAVQPLREQSYNAEPCRPGLAICVPISLLPAQEQVCADMLGVLALSKVDEAAEDSAEVPRS